MEGTSRSRARRPRAIDVVGLTRTELVDLADRAEAGDDLLGAIEALTAANLLEREDHLEVRLVALRHHAFTHLPAEPARTTWPPAVADPFPEVVDAPPEVAAADLDATVLGGAIAHHGCLLVRGLISPEQAAGLADDVDAAHEARSRRIEHGEAAAPTSWFAPFEDFDPPFAMDGFSVVHRTSVQPSLMAADSPRTLFDVLEVFEEVGLVQVIEDHLGERALLSVDKTTLRRTSQAWPSWHQDGSFMGAGMRTVDCWLALGHCGSGTDTVGLDIVPRRLDGIVPFNAEEGKVAFVVPPERVDEVRGDTPVVSPEFWAGDALLFDDLFLHCTGWPRPGHVGTRRAVEAWFFAASGYPAQYAPLVV